MEANSIAKITLRSSNFARTERFYHELFGWEFTRYSSTYMGFEAASGIDGGFQQWDSFSQGNSYLIYVLVEEFEPYLRRIPELGAGNARKKWKSSQRVPNTSASLIRMGTG